MKFISNIFNWFRRNPTEVTQKSSITFSLNNSGDIDVDICINQTSEAHDIAKLIFNINQKDTLKGLVTLVMQMGEKLEFTTFTTNIINELNGMMMAYNRNMPRIKASNVFNNTDIN